LQSLGSVSKSNAMRKVGVHSIDCFFDIA
jgi:hypothetical protein